MIHLLLQQIRTQLQKVLTGIHIAHQPFTTAPSKDKLPGVAIYGGPLEVSSRVQDTPATEPGPIPMRQEIQVDLRKLSSSYRLSKRPLKQSTQGELRLWAGTADEQRFLLTEAKEFTLNEAAQTVSFQFDLPTLTQVEQRIHGLAGRKFPLSAAQLSKVLFEELNLRPSGRQNSRGYYSTSKRVLERLRDDHPIANYILLYRRLKRLRRAQAILHYNFVGMQTIQDFQQTLTIEVCAEKAVDVEKLASLATATLLTHGEDLKTSYNRTTPTSYQAKPVSSVHELTQFHFSGGAPDYKLPSLARWILNFKISGRLTVRREITDGFGLIETIHSPGMPKGTQKDPISIEAWLQ